MSAGIPIPVNEPVPVPLANNLIAVARVNPTDDLAPEDATGRRWQGGLTVWRLPDPSSGGGHGVIDPCAPGTLPVRASSGGTAAAAAFTVVAAFTCSSLGTTPDALAQRVQAWLAAYEPAWVEAEVEAGSVAGAGAYTLAQLPDAGAGTWSVAAGIAELEGQRLTQGVLHLTPRLAALAFAARVIDSDNRGRLFTASGTPVVTGAGYGGAHASTTERAYMTGPVEVRRSEVILPSAGVLQAQLASATNDLTIYVERTYAIDWSLAGAHRITITR